jgi:3-methyl-2-oxobutanoate hydroxymethyltransferase
MSIHKEIKKVTTHTLLNMKQAGEKISMLTAYDFSMASILDEAGIDVLLVGDSASNVMAGHETTLPITLDQMIYHAQSVVRAVNRALVVVDLPFGTYQGNSKEALNSAIRVMKETGAHAIKLEGGAEVEESIKRIVVAGVPVMGHLGLTPQSIYKFGTYAVRAKEEAEANLLVEHALVAQQVRIPIIGIGAGAGVDGQVLVMHDLLGITKNFSPRFLRRYLDLHSAILNATKQYIQDVKQLDFPNNEEQY